MIASLMVATNKSNLSPTLMCKTFPPAVRIVPLDLSFRFHRWFLLPRRFDKPQHEGKARQKLKGFILNQYALTRLIEMISIIKHTKMEDADLWDNVDDLVAENLEDFSMDQFAPKTEEQERKEKRREVVRAYWKEKKGTKPIVPGLKLNKTWFEKQNEKTSANKKETTRKAPPPLSPVHASPLRLAPPPSSPISKTGQNENNLNMKDFEGIFKKSKTPIKRAKRAARKRKEALELKRQALRVKIETSMRQSREDIIHNVQTKQ